MIKNFDELLTKAKDGTKVRVVVAAAEDEAALTAVNEAIRHGLIEALLIGNPEKIKNIIKELDYNEADYQQIIGVFDEVTAAELAVRFIRAGNGDILLKGKTKTATLLKAVLSPELGLRSSKLVSDVFVMENPERGENQLMIISDGGVNPRPDIQQKIEIINNAVYVAHVLGYDEPRVALLSAIEVPTPKIQSTLDAAVISKMNNRGQIKGCIIDGPLALDNAISEEAARIKGIDSPVAGKADLLICPEIESANMLAKSTTYFGNLRLAHVVVGSIVPVLIPSRADAPEAKLLSIALGKLIYQYSKNNHKGS